MANHALQASCPVLDTPQPPQARWAASPFFSSSGTRAREPAEFQRAASRLSASQPPRTLLGSAFAGACAAGAATIPFYPVDTVKTVLQSQTASSSSADPRLWRTLSSFRLRGLYVGLVPAATAMAAGCSVRMGSYEVFKQRLPQLPVIGSSPGTVVFLSSVLSVVASATVRVPLDLLKTQVQAGVQRSTLEAFRHAAANGPMGFMRGASLSLMRDVPYFSINLLIYEKAREHTIRRRAPDRAAAGGKGNSAVDSSEAFLLGAAAQGVAAFATNPIDVLKTRVQAGAAQDIRSALRQLIQHYGYRGFFRGAFMRVVWIAPQGCIYYPVYEAVQSSWFIQSLIPG